MRCSKKTSGKLLVLGMFLLLFSLRSNGQVKARPFDFFGADLSLGVSEQVVLSQLDKLGLMATDFSDPASAEKSYLVMRPKAGTETSVHILGTLNFRKGKLSRAAKQWFSGNGSSYEFSIALQKAFASASEGAVVSCVIAQDKGVTPEANWAKTSFVCNQRTVEINVLSGNDESMKSVQIDEVMQQR